MKKGMLYIFLALAVIMSCVLVSCGKTTEISGDSTTVNNIVTTSAIEVPSSGTGSSAIEVPSNGTSSSATSSAVTSSGATA